MKEIRDTYSNDFCDYYSVSSQQWFNLYEKELEVPALYRVKYEAYAEGTWPKVPNCFCYILRKINKDSEDIIYVGESEQAGNIRPTSHGDDWDYCYVMTVNNAQKAQDMTCEVLLTLEDRLRDIVDSDPRYINTTRKTTKVVLDDRQEIYVRRYLNVVLQLLNIANLPLGTMVKPSGYVRRDDEAIPVVDVMKELAEDEVSKRIRLSESYKNAQKLANVVSELDEEESDSWEKVQKYVRTIENNQSRRAMVVNIPEEGMELSLENKMKKAKCSAVLYHDPTKKSGLKFVLKQGSIVCPESAFSNNFKKSSEYRGYREHVEAGDIVNNTVVRDIEVYPSHASSWSRGCISHGYSDWKIIGAEISLLDFLG